MNIQLKTFQDRKSRNENDISNISVNEIRAHDEESMEQPNFYDAVADGSQLVNKNKVYIIRSI